VPCCWPGPREEAFIFKYNTHDQFLLWKLTYASFHSLHSQLFQSVHNRWERITVDLFWRELVCSCPPRLSLVSSVWKMSCGCRLNYFLSIYYRIITLLIPPFFFTFTFHPLFSSHLASLSPLPSPHLSAPHWYFSLPTSPLLHHIPPLIYKDIYIYTVYINILYIYVYI